MSRQISATIEPPARWQPALAVLTLAMAATLGILPFLRTARNRLLSGEPVYFSALLTGPVWLLAVLLMMLFALSLGRPQKANLWIAVVASAALIPGFLALAASHAVSVAQTVSPIARTSLGGAFWLSVLLAGLACADALQRLKAGRLARALVAAAVVLPVGGMLAAGWCDELSILKEYTNRSDVFAQAALRHLEIVGIAMAFTLLIGLPLGLVVYRFRRLGNTAFPVLNIIQTIPSIALFGLLMAPLAWLAASLPALARAGISGVGMAPGVIALVLYSLLPVVRGMLAGLEQVPSGAREAASGLGMPASKIFWQVEVPLALPVLLAGIRTATIQAVGLAAVTALIGAGGLGAILFEGLFSNAQDLVLLGVLPIIFLGALTDALFRLLISLTALPGGASLTEGSAA